jgi:hypothetical protein
MYRLSLITSNQIWLRERQTATGYPNPRCCTRGNQKVADSNARKCDPITLGIFQSKVQLTCRSRLLPTDRTKFVASKLQNCKLSWLQTIIKLKVRLVSETDSRVRDLRWHTSASLWGYCVEILPSVATASPAHALSAAVHLPGYRWFSHRLRSAPHPSRSCAERAPAQVSYRGWRRAW